MWSDGNKFQEINNEDKIYGYINIKKLTIRAKGISHDKEDCIITTNRREMNLDKPRKIALAYVG